LNRLSTLANLLRTQRVALSVAGALIVSFIAFVGLWEYAGSQDFCGTLCHVNASSYETSRESPHDRVECVECHLGRGLIATQLARKLSYAGHAVRYLSQNFETPVYAEEVAPAQRTCERCHWPFATYDDTVVASPNFHVDEENTNNSTTYLILRTGGGRAEEGRGTGIHWHVENEVWYVSEGLLRQTIPFVRVVEGDGSSVDYVDVTADFDADSLREEDMYRMDCNDCHNRIAHMVEPPSKAMDEALAAGQISSDIPFIKAKGIEVLSGSYNTVEEGLQTVRQLEGFYGSAYPDFYNSHPDEVAQAIEVLQDILVSSVFPDLGVTWATHPDNSGHDEFPGCFRCHDGKHVSAGGETIRLQCNLCHSIPVTVRAGSDPPEMPVGSVSEPQSHLTSDWMADHRFVANEGCESCHGGHEFGTDDSNFCSNSSCHGRAWEWVGLDAAMEHPIELEGRHAELTCNQCHAQATKPDTECAACHGEPPHEWGSEEGCESCHVPTDWTDVESASLAGPVPHELEGREECLTCHDLGLPLAFPDDHEGRSVQTCEGCHAVTVSS
jgi:hypothetical protein